jgi:hypothetical protein
VSSEKTKKLDPATENGRLCRGQRIFCSNRGQRGGCGRTFSIFFADTLPRHTVSATLLWKLLGRLLAASSLKAAAQSLALPFVSDRSLPRASVPSPRFNSAFNNRF